MGRGSAQTGGRGFENYAVITNKISVNVKLNSGAVNEFQTANDVTQNAQINIGVRHGKLHFICVTPASGASAALKTCNFWERHLFKRLFSTVAVPDTV